MEEHGSYYLNQSDIRWLYNELPSQTTISQPDEVPLGSSMLKTNTHQTADSLFPPEPFSNHPEVSLQDAPFTSFRLHEPLSLRMGASESDLYGNCYNPMWEQPPLSSLLVGNVFPETHLPLQQSSPSNEYGRVPSILPDMGYPHLSSEFQQGHYPYGTLMEYVQSTEHMPRPSCDNPSSGIDNTTSLETIMPHTARNEEIPVAQLTLQEIYCWFEENTNKASGPNSTGWKNTIRYNLSMNVGFVSYAELSPDKSKTSFWTLAEEALRKGILPTTRQRRYGSRKSPKAENFSPLHQRKERSGTSKPIYKAPARQLPGSFVFFPGIYKNDFQKSPQQPSLLCCV
ncbi:uncharacterized protein TRUGW13939_00621 [Talaromyces rugulosus]|uniref:Fork-head domain-containing protein n=1 Tax=Talaromyces rugulosus TaxID=121627 RepID=A0A7H8QIS2_TALRU|nr:uncharacterized protein TRUGW13939_00621 [Talaromyces rugulosus]QKX53542.1 hypothetical protein TRUGW13939_00621 [Talaromyces rugulosus]